MKIVSKGKGEESFTLSFPLYISPFGKIKVQNKQEELIMGNYRVFLIEEGDAYIPRYLFRSHNFKTQKEAEELILKLAIGLRLIALKKKIGIDFKPFPTEIRKFEYLFPSGWTEAIKAGWEPGENGYSVDGVVNSLETFIIPENKKIIDDGSKLGTPIKVISVPLIVEWYNKNEKAIDLEKIFKNEKLELASQIFFTAYYHNISTLRFINLVTCLEILSKRKISDEYILELIREISKCIKEKKKDLRDNYKKEKADYLLNRIEDLKIESIRDAVCDIVFEFYRKTDDPELYEKFYRNRAECEKLVKEIYSIRSVLVHGGEVKSKKVITPDERLDQALYKLEKIVQNILYNEITKSYFLRDYA